MAGYFRDEDVPWRVQPPIGYGGVDSKQFLALINGNSGVNLVTRDAGVVGGSGFGKSLGKSGVYSGPVDQNSRKKFLLPTFADADTWTLTFRFLCTTTTPSSRSLVMLATTAGSGFIEISTSGTGGVWRVRANGANDRITGGSLVLGDMDACLTYDGQTLSFYLNGSLIGTYASATMGSGGRLNLWVGDVDNKFSLAEKYAYIAFFRGVDSPSALQRNPWRLFAPQTRRIWVPVSAGGGSTDLTVQDATHGHTADGPTFTLSSFLAAQDATHSQAADNLALTLATYLAIQDATHAHTADNLTLSVAGSTSLTIQDATHAHAADSITLATSSYLAVADALHAHGADNLALTLGGTTLAIQDTLHGHSADAIAFTLSSHLTIADALHAHAADNLTLSGLYSTLDMIYKILSNRQELNAATGKFVLYDDDDVSVLLQSDAWADAAGTVPYSGATLARVDRLH